jgi:hypothetical protein
MRPRDDEIAISCWEIFASAEPQLLLLQLELLPHPAMAHPPQNVSNRPADPATTGENHAETALYKKNK